MTNPEHVVKVVLLPIGEDQRPAAARAVVDSCQRTPARPGALDGSLATPSSSTISAFVSPSEETARTRIRGASGSYMTLLRAAAHAYKDGSGWGKLVLAFLLEIGFFKH
jgi:hypothetical protein